MRETMANNNIINYLYNLKMNNTLYTQLSDLGFGEWLEKNDKAINIPAFDEYDIDSLYRTQVNALAFRWLREEKGLDCLAKRDLINGGWNPYVGTDKGGMETIMNTTHELAEHEALNKAVEIIKGGENGL